MNSQAHHAAVLSQAHAFHCFDECLESHMDTAFQADSRSEERRSLRWPKNPSHASRQRLCIRNTKLPQGLDDQRSFDRG
jgi:hypothetical protein